MAKTALRRLRAGLVPHLKIMQYMNQAAWHRMSHDDRLEATMCTCEASQPGIQDMSHIFWDCAHTSDLIDQLAAAILDAAQGLSNIYGAKMLGLSTHERILAALHKTYTGSLDLGDKTCKMFRAWGRAFQYFTEQSSIKFTA